MDNIPMIGFAAWSGTGKTTLIEKLIGYFKGRGLRVAVIKHDGHDFEIDRPGKDSWRFTQAGADVSLITSGEKTALVERRGLTLAQAAALAGEVDLILVEGWKGGDFPRIGLARLAAGKDLPRQAGPFLAVVADRELPCGCPRFGFDDIEEIGGFILEYAAPQKKDFTHFNIQGRAKMVNVEDKPVSRRTAAAGARVLVSRETLELIAGGGMKKGDVLTVAQIAGVMGAKRTPDLIPMCHPVGVDGVDLELHLDRERCSVEIRATVTCLGRTGVEMEALTAASTAALTVYDMCKAVQRDMVITDLRLLEKTGGVHGDYHREEEQP